IALRHIVVPHKTCQRANRFAWGGSRVNIRLVRAVFHTGSETSPAPRPSRGVGDVSDPHESSMEHALEVRTLVTGSPALTPSRDERPPSAAADVVRAAAAGDRVAFGVLYADYFRMVHAI